MKTFIGKTLSWRAADGTIEIYHEDDERNVVGRGEGNHRGHLVG